MKTEFKLLCYISKVELSFGGEALAVVLHIYPGISFVKC